MLITDQQLIERIEAFLKRHDMAPTRFGREAAKEASLLTTLKSGRSVSLARANRIVAFMERYDRENALSPGNAKAESPSIAKVA